MTLSTSTSEKASSTPGNSTATHLVGVALQRATTVKNSGEGRACDKKNFTRGEVALYGLL